MQLRAIELSNLRNISGAVVEPHPRFNVLVGDNGQGKTNLLEAIYLLGTLRSFRAGKLEELVRFGETAARASARLERRGLERRYDVELALEPGKAARKVARVDGKAVRGTAEYFGGFNVVLFCPDDLRLFRGAPAARRRFLDRAVWNAAPGYLKEAQIYEKLLRSRNVLLRDAQLGRAPLRPDLLDVYDEQLAVAGAAIAVGRSAWLCLVAPRVQEAFERITQTGLSVALSYESSLSAFAGGSAALAAELLERLRSTRPRDLKAGYTTSGPHADDLEAALDARPASLYASQGQMRALVLALKVAEIQHLETVLDDTPILLLDDVSSELDPQRNAYLFSFLRGASGQVFITTTDRRHVDVTDERADFRVHAGTIAPEKPL